jgi:hypothetical protein
MTKEETKLIHKLLIAKYRAKKFKILSNIVRSK